MRSKSVLLTLGLATALLAGCGTVKRVSKATSRIVSGGSKVPPESVWNSERTWKRVRDTPPTYIPYNYSGPFPEDGEWFTDERDGKRLFVPPGGTEGLPAGVLRSEAWKATRDD